SWPPKANQEPIVEIAVGREQHHRSGDSFAKIGNELLKGSVFDRLRVTGHIPHETESSLFALRPMGEITKMKPFNVEEIQVGRPGVDDRDPFSRRSARLACRNKAHRRSKARRNGVIRSLRVVKCKQRCRRLRHESRKLPRPGWQRRSLTFD